MIYYCLTKVKMTVRARCIFVVQNECIGHCKIDQVEDQLLPPFHRLARHAIILCDLIRTVNPTHIPVVIDDTGGDCRVHSTIWRCVVCLQYTGERRGVQVRKHEDIAFVFPFDSQKVVPLTKYGLAFLQFCDLLRLNMRHFFSVSFDSTNCPCVQRCAALSVGQRICRLHPLQRGNPPNGATCWPWLDTRKV